MSEPERPLDPNDPAHFAPPGLRQANLGLHKPCSSAAGLERNPRQSAAPDDDRRAFASAGAGKARDAFAQGIINAMRAQREAEQVPPRLQLRERSTLAFKLSIGFAVAVFGGLSYVALQSPSLDIRTMWGWSALAAWQTAPYSPADRPRRSLLMVSNRSGFMNETLPLGVRVGDPIPAGNVLVKGVPANASLTAGVPIQRTEWRIDTREIAETRIIPPADFVGDLDLTGELLDVDGAVIVASGWQLTWKPTTRVPAAADARAEMLSEPARPLKATRQVQAEPQQLAMAPPVATAARGENPKSGQSLPSASPVPALARPDGPDAAHRAATGAAENPSGTRSDAIEKPEPALLVRNGTKLMSYGDISAARLMFEQAAEAGSAAAAFALAETYDPLILGRKTVPHDIVLARSWYEKARDLGVSIAEDRLARLTELQQ